MNIKIFFTLLLAPLILSGCFSDDVANQKARNAQRTTDVRTIADALELDFQRVGKYPNTAAEIQIPTDPLCVVDQSQCATYKYSYTSKDDGKNYSLTFRVEGQLGPYSGLVEQSVSGLTDLPN